MDEGNKKTVSRRDFLKGSAAVAATAALASGGLALVNNRPVQAAEVEKWDAEADAVVLGFGCAGALAALVAHDNGARVLVLEATPVPGGTTRTSGGLAWIPCNPIAKAEGIVDTLSGAEAYMKQLSGDQADAELIEAFLDQGPEMISYVQKAAPMKWFVGFYPDYHPEWKGGMRKGRSLGCTYNGMERGEALMAGLYDAAVSRGIKFMFSSRGKKLILNSQGRVVGIAALQGSRWVNIKANRGVVLSSGGFEWDHELVRHYLRGPHFATVNLRPGEGDALRMCMAIGADLRNMNECWGLPIYLLPGWEDEVKNFDARNYRNRTWHNVVPDWMTWRGKPGVIMVNRFGERFCNEGADYDSTRKSFFAWNNWGDVGYRNIPAWVIADSNEWGKWAFANIQPGSTPPAHVAVDDTLAGLARKLGIDPQGLEATVAEFNKCVKEKPPRDPVYHRGESYFDRYVSGDRTIAEKEPENPAASLAPVEKPPFYGLNIYPGSCGTCGGPRVNKYAQVLHVTGDVIPGLYAAGNASGVGAPGYSYGGAGGTIGPGMAFGYIAGLKLAAE